MDEGVVLKAIEGLESSVKGKIAEIDTAIVDDRRESAKTHREMKSAIERLEGSLDGLPEKWREDVKNMLGTMPNPKKQFQTNADVWIDLTKLSREDFVKMGDESNPALGHPEGVAFRKSFLAPAELQEMRRKAITATENTPGAPMQPGFLWSEAIVGDPWVVAGAFQMPLTAPNFNTVKVTDIAFANTSTVGATSFDAPKGSLTAGAAQHVKTYTCRVIVPNEQESDVMGTIAHVERMIERAYGKQRGSLTTAAIAAGLDDAGNAVKTGAANTAITTANALTKLLSLTSIAKLADYWAHRPAFVLHPMDSVTLYEAIGGKGGFTLDPQTGLMRLGAWPIHIDTQAEANATDDKQPDYFGSWEDAVIQAQRGRLTIDRYMATIPGAVAIYAHFRFKELVVNDEAYSGIVVGA